MKEWENGAYIVTEWKPGSGISEPGF